MSSEMRVTDAMVEAALDGLDNACMDIAKRELQPHDVLWRGFSRIRRMEAMRTALNAALLARTEAGADGYDDGSGRVRDWRESDTRPQDASGDAERFAAVMNCQWLRSSKYGDQVLGWREEFLSRVNAEVVAMQAKEAK